MIQRRSPATDVLIRSDVHARFLLAMNRVEQQDAHALAALRPMAVAKPRSAWRKMNAIANRNKRPAS